MTIRRLVAIACCLPFFIIYFFLSENSPYAKHRVQGETYQPSSEPERVYAVAEDNFSWESISPAEELVWTDCYSDNQCARLKVPLDYAHPDGTSAAIAMIRLHSAVPHDSPSYRGPILINPGGPGGSGVDLAIGRGALISTVVGPEFDIIGFDPRGIGRSTPRVSFFASRPERAIWSGDFKRTSMNSSVDALPHAYARGIVEGQLAGERDDGSLRFIHTDHTARDMLRIVQAHGHEKIQYWGFSYGSVLGATFASMFPDNVGRLVIDGVADSENYFATEWNNNLIDTDKAWMAFVDGCVAAGPNGCAFYAPTAAELSNNLENLYASLRARPIPVRTNTSFGVVDYSTLRYTIFQALYAPYQSFPTLARALADLSKGNATALFKMSETPAFECACDPSQYRFESVGEAGNAVLCNDGKRISPEYEDLLAHYQGLSNSSGWADVWENIRLPCLAWPDFPKNHFQGPFVADTSFPLLLVGTTADPVTPLWAAKKMSQGFNGSVVLTQDSAGHCSISGPSICTQKHIRRYFLNGTLPDPGTVCAVNASPFPASGSDSDDADIDVQAQAILGVPAEDRELSDAVWKLAKTFDFRFPTGI
ncbi:TAP-like protein-domain-containing protein [Mycena olivaceomarginata]|nr:TAP-like protein-domain-containing protein [Mycena olivaceomarginata]